MLSQFLRTYTGNDWLEIANQFNVEGTNKEKSDYVRRLHNKEKNKGLHLVIGCVHVPFHNEILLQKLLTFITDNKEQISGFHIVGDFLDLKSLSTHDVDVIDKTGWTLGKEYKEGNKVLDRIDAVLPEYCQKTFIYGNHSDRFNRYISNIRNYKHSDAIASPKEALKLQERGYIVYTNWKEDYVQIGKYQLFHGQFCNQNPAKTHTLKSKTSCVFFHTHRIDQYYEKGLHGINGGCLADLESPAFKYASRYERELWQNAFVVINDGEQAELIISNNNTFYFGGKKY